MDALTPWRPMQELETIQRRMEDMFDRLTKLRYTWVQVRTGRVREALTK